MEAMVFVGQEGFSRVANYLGNTNPIVRAEALRVLAGLGTNSPVVMQAVTGAFGDADPSVRVAATNALGVLQGGNWPMTVIVHLH